RTMTGAIMTTPAASASHHLVQVWTASAKPESLATTRPATAIAELIIAVGAMAMSVNFAMRGAVANVLEPYDQRLISHAPTTAASVVPIAMAVGSRSKLADAAPELMTETA